jgi:hypothetical protein
MIENTNAIWLYTVVKGKGTLLSTIPIPFIPKDTLICPASTVLNLLHMAKEKHGVKTPLFIDCDMGTPLAVYKVRFLLNYLLSCLGFSQEKTPISLSLS